MFFILKDDFKPIPISSCVESISVLIPQDIGGTFFKIGARITSLWQKEMNGSSALNDINIDQITKISVVNN